MRLDDQRESDYVEDRRVQGGYGGRRGISMGTIMMLWPLLRPLLRTKFGRLLIGGLAVFYFMGIDPLALSGGGAAKTSNVSNTAKDDARAKFVRKVLASTEDVWSALLPKYGLRYQKPVVVLYRGYTHSGCGGASSQMGPFYCPRDKKIYLDLSFFDELARRHDAPGDFAQAYVLAHEVGHHIQDLLGTLDKVHRAQARTSKRRANALQVRTELQADCYAGVWGHYADKRLHQLDRGDLQEALDAAAAIGDDTLQRKAGMPVRPDAFTHGSSKERMRWFLRGFESGDLRACNTFR